MNKYDYKIGEDEKELDLPNWLENILVIIFILIIVFTFLTVGVIAMFYFLKWLDFLSEYLGIGIIY